MSLFHRVDYVTLSESENETEIRTIEAELEQNGYPQRFIEQTKRKALRKYGKKTHRETHDGNRHMRNGQRPIRSEDKRSHRTNSSALVHSHGYAKPGEEVAAHAGSKVSLAS